MLQTKCLLSTEGHQWMDMFDDCPPSVRERLRESPLNLCMFCLIEAIPYPDRRNPDAWFYCIEQFEKGNDDDLRERLYSPRQDPYGRIIPESYGLGPYPSPYLDDPRRYSPRSLDYPSARVSQDRLVERRRADLIGLYESNVDWQTINIIDHSWFKP